MRPRLRGSLGPLACAALASILPAAHAIASGPPVLIAIEPGTDAALARRVREVVASRRSVRDEAPMPAPSSVSPERAAMDQRAASIRLALDRARRFESEAAWGDCVREAASAMSDAVLVLAKVSDLTLLRDLHVQIGACATLGEASANARPHLIAAALLDESAPKPGAHREEAERAQAEARAEVLARSRGKITIESTPPGAEVWIDGRKINGVTPVIADVRLGDHYLTLRRFRYEPHAERTVLQPSGVVRVALEPARRETLREQLAAIAARPSDRPPPSEELLARAVWSRADQIVAISPAKQGSLHAQVIDATTGQVLRSADVRGADNDEALKRAVCGALGETCEVKRGVPWYAWPIAGAAIVGAAVSVGVIVDAARGYRFCPSRGCP